MREFLWFVKELAAESFHGALRKLEIAEAVLAVALYAATCIWPEMHWLFGPVFMGVLVVFVLTFLSGMLWIAYLHDKRLAAEKTAAEVALRESRTPKAMLLDEVEAGTWRHHFRIIVRNDSEAVAEGVGALLLRSEPPMHYLPAPLHCMHLPRPNSAAVDMNPGVERRFDVFRVGDKRPGQLELTGAAVEEVIPLIKYRLTIRLHGRNIQPLDKDFLFEPRSNGMFAFYAAPQSPE